MNQIGGDASAATTYSAEAAAAAKAGQNPAYPVIPSSAVEVVKTRRL